MEAILTVTAKGQVTLRKELLAHLGLAPGDKIAVELLPAGRAEIRPAKAGGGIESFLFSLPAAGKPSFSIDDINDAAARGWAGER